MIKQEELIEIGKFQKTHALKGELNAIIKIDVDFLEEGNPLIVDIEGIYVPFYATSIRDKGKTSYLLKIKDIDNEEEAKPFVNKSIYALKSELAPFLDMDEEELRDEDYILGFEVFDSSNETLLGKIIGIDTTTSNVLIIVETPDGETIMIPAVDEFVTTIDENQKMIKVNLPEGLIDLNK